MITKKSLAVKFRQGTIFFNAAQFKSGGGSWFRQLQKNAQVFVGAFGLVGEIPCAGREGHLPEVNAPINFVEVNANMSEALRKLGGKCLHQLKIFRLRNKFGVIAARVVATFNIRKIPIQIEMVDA